MIENKPVALTDWTYKYLREQLLNMELQPGEQVRVEDYTDKLEISRTPVREAFLRLASEGLIKVLPRVGYFVTEISEKDIREVCEVREIVESEAVRKAAETLSDEDLELLRGILTETKQAITDNDLTLYLQYEIKFHEFLHKNFHNARLLDFMNSLDNVIYRGRVLSIQNPSTLENTPKEHEKILEALIERNGDLAAHYMREHLRNISDRLVDLLNIQEKSRKEVNNE